MNGLENARPLSKTRLPGLDTLRGVAIVVVVIHNLSILEPTSRALTERLWIAFEESGWVGVQLFFVLSGFLITGILLDDRDQPGFVRSFYGRRFFRIFPLYYVLLAFHFFVLPRLAPELAVPARQAPWLWLYLSNWSFIAYGHVDSLAHTWSLAVEEQFYVVWPWVVAATRPRTLAWICAAVCLGSFASRVILHEVGISNPWLYMSTLTRADALAMGALVALAFRSGTWRPRLARLLAPISVATAVLLAALLSVTHGLNRYNPYVEVYGYSLLGVGSAVLVARLGRPEYRAGAADRVLGFFGKYSYGLYVIHVPLKIFALHFLGEELAEWSAASPHLTELGFIGTIGLVSLLLALASWVILEKPFLRLKDRLAPR